MGHTCPFNGVHLFLKCKEVKKVWRLIGLEEVCERMCGFTAADSVVQEILELKEADKILVCCTLWRWWLGRNKLNAEGQALSVEAVVKQARYWASESVQYCSKASDKISNNDEAAKQDFWRPPEGDMLKINIDGAFAADSGTGGWGFVVRDQTGAVRGSGAGW
uniref:Uncharacterized protein n=1 Tax=Avena sativa TaxID=4498 RepID=A0ACD5Z2Z1_AVESA